MTDGQRQIVTLLGVIRDNGGGEGGSNTLPWTEAGKFRFKADGSFQLYNGTTSKYHTLSLSGPEGSVVIDIGAGES